MEKSHMLNAIRAGILIFGPAVILVFTGNAHATRGHGASGFGEG